MMEHWDMETDVNPEVEPLSFNIDTQDVPPDIRSLLLHTKEVAEKLLYKWKNFPITLPTSVTGTQQGEGAEEMGVISFKDLFTAPTFEELEEVARGNNDQAKKLNDEQLQSVRKTGEFTVKSLNFPGQFHKWRLSLLLQKGTERAHDTLLNDMALALRLLIITARNRIYSHFFSLSQSLFAIKQGLWEIIDMLIGMPSTTPGVLYKKLHEEHSRFLVAEFNVLVTCRRDGSSFCDYVKDKCNPENDDKSKTTEFKPPPFPHKFLTPKGFEIDLRLFNRDLMVKCTDVLKKILEKESKGWYIKYKDRLITELKGQDLSYEDITNHVNKSIKEEYLRRVFQAVLYSEQLEEIQPRIGKLLVEQATSVLVMEKALENVREKLQHHQLQHRTLLITNYPVRSRIRAWMNERLQEFEEDFIEQNQWVAHEVSLQECRRNDLEQAVYFLQRDLIFLRDREPVLKKELSKVQEPNRVYTFACRIWFPGNWVVKRHLYGETEVIPTVITETPQMNAHSSGNTNTLQYTVEKYIERKTSTRYPFWRWINYFHRTWAWTWNAMFWLGLVIPFCSPCSLRALVSPRPFTPDLILNQVNGTLCPKYESRTHTLVSRLSQLWHHVRNAMQDFDSEPDTGFLGKSCTRHLNRFWNYVCKGALGSAALVLVMVPMCLLASLLSLLAAATAPLWMPFVCLCGQIVSIIFYDYDHSVGNAIMYIFEALVFRLLIQGCIQPVCALFTALVILPLSAFFVLLAGVLRRGGRATWDAFMFYAVIKKRGRVPCRDSFIAKRIEGPGLASNYFFQVKPAQALASVEACVELHELNAWNENTAKLIQKPLEAYRLFVDQCFVPFSASLHNSGVYNKLEKDTKAIICELTRLTAERKKKLHTGLSDDIRLRIKLTARELKVTIAQTAKMLESFYPMHVLGRLDQSEEEFWEGRHLEVNDWQGLGTQLLTEMFSSSFLTPLEDTDTCFKLEVVHLNLSRYLDMLKSAEFREDLDVVNTVHTPKGDIDVDAPYMELYTFSPLKERIDYESTFMMKQRKKARRRPWKKKSIMLKEIEKLEVPIPVAHPAVICALINNRDNDQEPIDLDNPICYKIFKAAEQMRYIELHDLHNLELYETEASTPDHTTNSEPDVPLSHLAEQESSPFSSDNLHSTSPDSVPDSSALEMTASATDPGQLRMIAHVPLQPTNSHDENHARVMYHEAEANTSCVLLLDEDSDDGEPPAASQLMLERPARRRNTPDDVCEQKIKLGDTPEDDEDKFTDARDYPEGSSSLYTQILQPTVTAPRSDTV